ncbi:thiaminase II [Paucilactobacillus kaifaensis]|uniref:thiaminase II n=1 Tax=Paucilactobacillus kaifaensis TaxID=2559921 RepID=UPI0010F8B655|nr:thiaminase II [Paucilactobacillus kaifaensis]
MNFTDKLHHLAQPLWSKSFTHPFIQELTAGNLPITKFKFYLKQDNYYLTEFATLHQLIAAKLSNMADKKILLAGATFDNNDELLVRNAMFAKLGITDSDLANTKPTPAAYNYITHMYYELNTGSPARATAALLPCYWLYSEIGARLEEKSSPVPIYQQFIDGYAGDEFTNSTRAMINLVEKMSSVVDATERNQMINAFLKSSAFELQFWEMAYQQKQWSFESRI